MLTEITAKKRDEIILEAMKRRGERYNNLLERFKQMTPFKSEKDIPDLPLVENDDYNEVIVPNLIRCGALPLEKLQPNRVYIGKCRNSKEGLWNGKEFICLRQKMGFTLEFKINHFQEDDGHDIFVPLKEKDFNNNLDKYKELETMEEMPYEEF